MGSNVLLTAVGEPVVLNWDAIRFDVIGSDLAPGDLDKEYAFKKGAAVIGNPGSRIENLPEWALPLVVHSSHLDSLITKEAYGAALEQVPKILELLEQIGNADAGSPVRASSQLPA